MGRKSLKSLTQLRKLFIALPAMNAYSHGTAKRERNRWLRNNRLFKVPFIFKGKSYGDRLPNNASCILSVFNVKYGHQGKLNYTSILSVELIAKTPKSMVTSGVGHLLTVVNGNVNIF